MVMAWRKREAGWVLIATREAIEQAGGRLRAGVRRRRARGAAVKDKNGEMTDLMHTKLANKLLERAARIGGRP
jgi:citrate lyase beta subunit